MKNDFVKKGGQSVKKFAKSAGKITKKSTEHVKKVFIERVDHVHKVRNQLAGWLFLVAMLILFAGVQFSWYRGAYETTVFSDGGTYVEATLGKVSTLNPVYVTTNTEKTAVRLLFSSLYSYDTNGGLKGDLANSMELSEDGKTYSVTLRDDAKWHDGEPVTAEDVEFTVGVMKDPAVRSAYYSTWKDIEVKAVDTYRVEVKIPSSYVGFKNALTFAVIPKHLLKDIPPERLREANFNLNPIGSGAFKFRAVQSLKSESESLVLLAKNDSYYKGDARLDRFHVHGFSDKGGIIAALDNSEVSATAELFGGGVEKFTQKGILEKETAVNNGVYAFLNLKSDVLKDINTRKALQKGLDIDAVRAELGSVRELDLPVLSSQIELSIQDDAVRYDKEASSELLGKAGYKVVADKLVDEDGFQPSLRLVVVKDESYAKTATMISEQLTKMGFAVNLDEVDSKDFFQNVLVPRDYDILIYEIEMGADPDMFAYYHSSQISGSGLNLSNYANAIADDTLLSARSTTDTSLRKAKYESFVKKWLDDVPAIGVYQVNMAYYYNQNVKSFSDDISLVSTIDRFSDVQYWAVSKEVVYRTP